MENLLSKIGCSVILVTRSKEHQRQMAGQFKHVKQANKKLDDKSSLSNYQKTVMICVKLEKCKVSGIFTDRYITFVSQLCIALLLGVTFLTHGKCLKICHDIETLTKKCTLTMDIKVAVIYKTEE